MSDIVISNLPSPGHKRLKTMAWVVHALYVANLVLGASIVVGVVLAYIKRGDARGTIWESHFTYAIRTFWLSIALVLASIVLTFVFIGPLVLVFSLFWYLARMTRAVFCAFEGRAISNPTGFF